MFVIKITLADFVFHQICLAIFFGYYWPIVLSYIDWELDTALRFYIVSTPQQFSR